MSKKRFAVVARDKQTAIGGIAGHAFKGKGQIYLDDEGEANEISKEYGNKKAGPNHHVNVVEDPRLEWHVKNDGNTDGNNVTIHHFTFGSDRAFRDAWEEFEKRKALRNAENEVKNGSNKEKPNDIVRDSGDSSNKEASSVLVQG